VDVGTEWVNSFDGDCPQNALAYCNETSEGFVAAMVGGGHRAVFDRGDGAAQERDFRAILTGDGTSEAIDTVGIAHFSSHGATGEDGVFRGYFASSLDACCWSSSEARLGDGVLDFLCLDTCESIDLVQNPIDTWGRSFCGLHLLCGFTGLVSDSPWTSDRGNRFGARVAVGSAIGPAWIDECSCEWLEDHPVVMAAGRTPEDAEQRLHNDGIGGGADSIPNEQITAFVWMWRS
jgi:Family of unknown function (DUF6345)